MKSYLMMLYVTFEQESALKKFFHVQGWSFCKPDLSVTTDKLGPTIYRTSVKEQPELLKPLYKEKRMLKPGNIQESPPAKLPKTAEGSFSTQNKQSEIKETCSAEESGAEEQLPVTFANATNSYEQNKTQSSTSIVLPDGNEVTVKMEADESDGNGADDTLGNSDNNEDDDTDVDYSFEGLEEGELRLKTEDVSDTRGDQIGDNSTLDNSAEDQSQEKAQTSGKQKPEGAKGKTVDGNFVCCTCAKTFKWKRSLKLHEKKHTGDRPYLCEICTSSFSCKDSLSQHMAIHSTETRYTCDFCGKKFTRRSCYHQHRRVHLPEKHFHCLQCGKSFVYKQVYTAHCETHSGKKQCEKCNKWVLHLNRHLKLCGMEETRHICHTCGKGFKQQRCLREHCKSFHEGTEKYVCQKCGKKYRLRSSLNYHKKKCNSF